jgi:Pentapeptide repeats (8 copies)
MNTSEQYHQPVLEALCAFVRDGTKAGTDQRPPATDIQAAITVIGGVQPEQVLSILWGSHISKADLSDAYLSGAHLFKADLSGASLFNLHSPDEAKIAKHISSLAESLRISL